MKQTLRATLHHVTYEWLTDDTDPLFAAAARKGFQEWLTDAASTAKPLDSTETDVDGKVTLACRQRNIEARLVKIIDGTYSPKDTSGGSSRGPRQDYVVKGWLDFLRVIKHKEGGKAVTGATLGRAQETLFRQEFLRNNPGATSDMVAQGVMEKLDAWIERFEQKDEDLVGFIALNRAVADRVRTAGLRFR